MNNRRAIITFVVATLAIACQVIPRDPPERFGTIVHKRFEVSVTVRDQVADVTVRPTFHNPNSFVVEGTYFLALPADAQVQDFKLLIGGKEFEAELLDAQKARQIYQQIVQKQRDPALLELVGTQMLKASVAPVPPNSDFDVVVNYTSLLKDEAGLLSLDIPFTNQFGADYPVPQVSVSVDIESRRAIKSIYSPTHAVEIVKQSDRAARVRYQATNYSPRKRFQLAIHRSDDEVGLSMLTFRQPGEDGFFALLASPKVEVEKAKLLPKDVVFVLDRSGSMAGEKIQQGREALATFIASLNEQDRFNIVDFSSEACRFESGLVEATRESRARATRYAEALKAAGSTHIDEALAMALEMFPKDPARMPMVLFVTDGLPTVGEQRLDKILENVRAKNAGATAARVFVFGVGHDVNTQFLDRLAEEHRGARDYVAPEEKIEAKVSGLIQKVSNPILSSMALDFGGLQVQELYPKVLPDLFQGSQLVMFGRYRGTGPAKVTLKGAAGGTERSFTYDVFFPERETRQEALPRLWASRKIAFLMDGIRLGGTAPQEVVDEIVALGKRYGIVTPYTSFLITEDNVVGMRREAERGFNDMAGRAKDSGGASGVPAAPAESTLAQAESKKLQELRKGASTDDLEEALEAATERARRQGRPDVGVKVVGAKTFFLRNGIWTDSAYDEKDIEKAITVTYLSDEYFKLAEDAALAKLLSVGESLIVVFEGKIYRIVK
ncbi:MAG: VWA domain-containing protein [Planctomycetes bacterium]|nr:VWA domain-containing protein [Planctomycetota bacterium]